MQMHTVLHSWAPPVQHWESALWSQVSSACLVYMLDRYTGFLWVGLQCDCFSRFSSLTDNIRHRNLLCRIPDINKYKTENPPQMHTNTKRQQKKQHLRSGFQNPSSPQKKIKIGFLSQVEHCHIPKYTERANTKTSMYSRAHAQKHLPSLRAEVEVGCTCFAQGVLRFH